ncbi:LysM peptidoglycan-binding domain-containing protein [Candidatus Calescamantes bacterium]|nr:LysM peptidoglycan-binding domain-containing protein [Candidatus Calescamantes bacterium]
MRKGIIFGIFGVLMIFVVSSAYSQQPSSGEVLLNKLRELGWRMVYYKSEDKEIWGNRGYIVYHPEIPEYKEKKEEVKISPPPLPQPRMLSQEELKSLRNEIQKTLEEFALEREKRKELENYLADVEEQLKAYKEEVIIEKGKTYTVVKGDSLWKISEKFYGTPLKWPLIYKANQDKIKDPNRIYPGQKLVIPVEEISPSKKYLK